MVFNILIGAAVILIIANILISFVGPKKSYNLQHNDWHANQNSVVPEVVRPVETKAVEQKEFLNFGKVIANEQKLTIMNQRVTHMEKAVAEIGKKELSLETNEAVDFERIEFKVKLLEQEIDEIKNPKPKPTTF